MRVIINRSLDGKFTKVTEALEEFGQVYGRKVAETLVIYSPVDTGVFMSNYYASSGPSSAGTITSSHGQPKGQPFEPYARKAISNMMSGISLLKGSTSMFFGNSSDHADFVEYKHGYAPFRKTASLHSRMAKEAWEEVSR